MIVPNTAGMVEEMTSADVDAIIEDERAWINRKCLQLACERIGIKDVEPVRRSGIPYRIIRIGPMCWNPPIQYRYSLSVPIS